VIGREIFRATAAWAVLGEFVVIHPAAGVTPRLYIADPLPQSGGLVGIEQVGHDPAVARERLTLMRLENLP